MMVKIPATIDVIKLLKDQNLTKTRTKNLKDKIHYFLSILTRTNDNAKYLYDNGNYKKICSEIQKQIHGNADYYLILKVLESCEIPIIERNGKWKNSSESIGYCQGFRINANYDTGETKAVRINKSLSTRIIENSKSDIQKSYKFLTDQFKNHKISIDDRVYEYLEKYYKELKSLTNGNQFQDIFLKNHIGRCLEYINKIKNKDLWFNVSTENHRLNSTFTSIPKILRSFILIDNQPLEMIDIKSSQPYILSSIIKSRYFLESTKGYNLKTINSNTYKTIISKINESTKLYTNNPITPQSSPYKLSITRMSLYMWCEFLSENECQSLIEYGSYQFKNDFYTDIIDKNIAEFDDKSLENREKLREKLKNSMMLVLFDDNYKNRNNNLYIQLFNNVYPGVNVWLERIHKMIGKKEFSYLMQRTESYLLLNCACREFNEKYPKAPIFTIHDGLYTTKEYINELTQITKENLIKITGATPGIKHSRESISTYPESNVIDSRWKKIKAINTKSKFEKAKHTILDYNLKLAEDFIKNW